MMKYMQSVIRCDGTVVMLQKKKMKKKNPLLLGLKKNGVMPMIWIPSCLAGQGNGKRVEAEMK